MLLLNLNAYIYGKYKKESKTCCIQSYLNYIHLKGNSKCLHFFFCFSMSMDSTLRKRSAEQSLTAFYYFNFEQLKLNTDQKKLEAVMIFVTYHPLFSCYVAELFHSWRVNAFKNYFKKTTTNNHFKTTLEYTYPKMNNIFQRIYKNNPCFKGE